MFTVTYLAVMTLGFFIVGLFNYGEAETKLDKALGFFGITMGFLSMFSTFIFAAHI